MNYNVEGLNDLAKQFHQFQIDAGFTDSSITQRLMLVHSEISEAFEAFRKNRYAFSKYKNDKFKNDLKRLLIPEEGEEAHWKFLFEESIKDSFEDELADSIIRLLGICAENNVDIEKHIKLKMKYNELRGFKYGGKKF